MGKLWFREGKQCIKGHTARHGVYSEALSSTSELLAEHKGGTGTASKFLNQAALCPSLTAGRQSCTFLTSLSPLVHFFPQFGHHKTPRAIPQGYTHAAEGEAVCLPLHAGLSTRRCQRKSGVSCSLAGLTPLRGWGVASSKSAPELFGSQRTPGCLPLITRTCCLLNVCWTLASVTLTLGW